MRGAASIFPPGIAAHGRRRAPFTVITLTLAALTLMGCRAIDLDEQRYLAKPSMQFSEHRSTGVGERIAAQLEPGRVLSGGAQASVCPACR